MPSEEKAQAMERAGMALVNVGSFAKAEVRHLFFLSEKKSTEEFRGAKKVEWDKDAIKINKNLSENVEKKKHLFNQKTVNVSQSKKIACSEDVSEGILGSN